MKKVIVYPGRFQPMLPHHAEVFKKLQSMHPDAEVYIGTSSKVELPKSPFDFEEKKKIMTLAHGIPADRILQVRSPYAAKDYENYFRPEDTVLMLAVGQKDMEEDPRFNFGNVDPKTGLNMKKNGSEPTWLQPESVLKNTDMLPMKDRGYLTVASTVSADGDVASASRFRAALHSATTSEEAKEIFTKFFGSYNDDVFNLVYSKILSEKTMESIEELKKLAGIEEATPVQFSRKDDEEHDYDVSDGDELDVSNLEDEPEEMDDTPEPEAKTHIINQIGRIADAGKEGDKYSFEVAGETVSTDDVDWRDAQAFVDFMGLSKEMGGLKPDLKAKIFAAMQKPGGVVKVLDLMKGQGLLKTESAEVGEQIADQVYASTLETIKKLAGLI